MGDGRIVVFFSEPHLFRLPSNAPLSIPWEWFLFFRQLISATTANYRPVKPLASEMAEITHETIQGKLLFFHLASWREAVSTTAR
jgi:hypothetical protein